jgi:Omp85 superfamily domain
VVAGILANAGVRGFLGNMQEFYDLADDSTPQWESFLEIQWLATLKRSRGTKAKIRNIMLRHADPSITTRLDQKAVAAYTDPHFRGSGWSSLFSASVERTTENPTFEARLAEGTWQLEKPLNKDKTRRIQLRYQFRRTIVSNLLIPGLVLPQDQRLRLSTLSTTWIRDTRDNVLDASRGFYQTLDFGITPRVLAGAVPIASEFSGCLWSYCARDAFADPGRV